MCISLCILSQMLKIMNVYTCAICIQFSSVTQLCRLRPHGLQQSRLPYPSSTPKAYSNSCPSSWWCPQPSHSLSSPSPPAFNFSQHQGIFSHVQLFCDPMDCSPPGSSVHGILQARILEWVAMPSTMGSFLPRDQTQVSCISCISRQILYH